MRVYISLDSREFVVSPTLLQRVSTLYFTRRDKVPVEVQFVRGGQVVELDASAAGTIGLKKTYGGGFLAFDGTWLKSGSGTSTVYTFGLNLNTDPLNNEFPLDTEDSIDCKVEIEWSELGMISSTLPTQAVIYNDIIRGSESVFTIVTLTSFQMASNNFNWTISVDDQGSLTVTKN